MVRPSGADAEGGNGPGGNDRAERVSAGEAGARGAPDVLVVEDDPEINRLLGAYVQICGYAYRSAYDGASALAAADAHRPDAVILDVMLPDLDGFEICRRLKSHENGRTVPIILLTALDGDDSRRKGYQCGAAEYLTKPFDPDLLMQTIERHVRARG